MITHIDHLVLTVASVDKTCDFYARAFGFERQDVAGKPTALHFGSCKINVHQADHTFEPKAAHPTLGSGDFCLIADQPLSAIEQRLKAAGIAVEQGPLARHGARGPMQSLYLRDPDRNLVEISRYD